MKAINIRVDHLKAPLGLENSRPFFTWNADGGIRQSAYSYVLTVNGETVYESGKIPSSEMSFLSPVIFRDREEVRMSITLYDENGLPGEAQSVRFEMGIHEWKAEWIDPEPEETKERQPASCLRKKFVCGKAEKARLYITAHGLYKAFINHKPVSDFVLAPGSDDYRRRIQYQVYDVNSLLEEGNNLIEVIIGDGWYRGNNGIDGSNHVFGDDLSLICQLETDGKIALLSGDTWEASQSGPIRFSDMEIGEVYDARMEEITDWHKVAIAAHDKSVLVCSDEVIIKEQERFEGKRIETPDGSIVYDFGQNLAGYTEMCFDAKEGQTITLRHGETLDGEGNFTQANIDPGKRNRNGGIPQKIVYTCKEGLNVYKPSFSIFGFRYIKVETDIDLSDAQFTAIAVYSDMEETASFTCSNKDVDQLFRNSLWSMKSNFTDIPTDCPHRERSGWTGDAGVFVDTGLLLHDSYTVFRKWLTELRFVQRKDGVVANIAPPINKGGGITRFMDGSTGWGDACILVPYAMYRATGDRRILEENYGMMVRWLGYLQKLAKKTKLKNRFHKDPYRDYIIEKGFHWGEWCQPDVDSSTELRNNMSKGAPKSATAYYFYSSRLLSEISGILGKKEEEKEYKALSDRIREAYIHTFTEDGIVHSDRQCDYVRPLRFDLIDRKEENAALLNEMIVQNGYHLNTGFLSTPFLCPILCEYGYTDTAYRLLLQEESPSWLYAVKQGATTIWEHWNGAESAANTNGSLNHYSYGAVSGWLISGVCGIQVNNGRLTVRPCPNRLLEYASANFKSPLGDVSSSWKYEGDELVFTLQIPANVLADVRLPDGSVHELTYGVHELRCPAS